MSLIIIEKAREYRKSNPGLRSAKVHAILKQMFEDTGCFSGRDTFIEMLRKHGLMVYIAVGAIRQQIPNHNYNTQN